MRIIQPRIYLASQSPRRRELLKQIGINFEMLLMRSDPRRNLEVDEKMCIRDSAGPRRHRAPGGRLRVRSDAASPRIPSRQVAAENPAVGVASPAMLLIQISNERMLAGASS